MDAVITYVNGEDKFWREEYKKYVKTTIEEARYRDWGTLQYVIKGIRKFMPFIEHIYLVVSASSQIENIDTSEVNVVYHKDIIPERYLPCFNSRTIEMFLYKIPSLSEEFVYFNDDTLVLKHMEKSDFFIDGKPVLNPHLQKCSQFDRLTVYAETCKNSTDLIRSKFVKKYPNNVYILQEHIMRPMLKSTCEIVWEKCEREILNSLTRIRTKRNYNVYLFNNYDVAKGNYVQKEISHKYVKTSDKLENIINTINSNEFTVLCINDNGCFGDFNEFKTQIGKSLEANLNKFVLPDKPVIVQKTEPTNIIKDIYPEGISICISAYKASKYIKETLDSITNQTWFKTNNNWECIVGIDGCYETLDYIKAIMNEYDSNHFRFYMMDSNKGTYVTSNTLMSKIAKYNWLIRFDADDIMEPNMIETVVDNIDEDTDIIRVYLQNFADADYTLGDIEKINKSYISYGQICIRHDKFNEYGGYLSWACSADTEFLARTRKFLKQKRLKNVLFRRRISDNSLTNSSATDAKSQIRQKYRDYVDNISLKIKDKNAAINKNLETNTYNNIKPYEIIISLTSFPQRIMFVKSVLESIVNTSVDRDLYKLVVVLSIEEFPNKENDLPKELFEYCVENLIEIIWTYKNIRSHKKLIPTIKKYSSLPVLVIDDDIIRNEGWLKMFINDHRKYPQDILCMRCDDYITPDFECVHDRSNFEDGVGFENYIYHNRPSNGCGGLLYPAHTFNDDEFFDEDLFMKLSPSSDEMWQYCFNVMNGQRIRRTSGFFDFESIKGSQKNSLYKENKGKYTAIMQTLLNYFPMYRNGLAKLFNEEQKLNNETYKGIIALTSWKKRITTVHKTIINLLALTERKYKIVLTLSIEEFQNKENDLPNELLSLLAYDNFEIIWIYKNYKVFKKVLFAMQKYQNLPIISADDDMIYKYNYPDELYDVWTKNKECVVSEGYGIKYNINGKEYKFSRGCATLYPPGSLLGATKYLNDEIINTQNDDSFYGIYFHKVGVKIINMRNDIKNLLSPHTNNDSLTINVKNKEDFYKDKLIILENIDKYKEL